MAASQSQNPSATLKSQRTVLIVCLLLATAVFLVFGQTLRHPFVSYDDSSYVYENREVAKGLTFQGIIWAFTHGHAANWHPLTWLSHMLDCQLYGLNAGGHHLTNVLLHAATAILLFLTLRRLTGTLWPGAFVAAVFAIHPLRVESVAWVSERKDVLSGLFFMLTLLMYARYVEKSKVQSPKSKAFYGLALLCFVLGLMSKPMLVTLPFVLLLLDYWPLRRFELSTLNSSASACSLGATAPKRSEGGQLSTLRRLALEKLPFLVLSAASCVVTVFAQKSVIAPTAALPLWLRISNALVACVTYLGQMFYPARLTVLYPYPEEGLPLLEITLALALLTGISATVFAWWRTRPYLVVGWLWYLGMLVPVIGLVQVGGQAHADRYTYLPQIGLYLLVAWTVKDLSASWRYRCQVLGAAALGVVAASMACAFIQTSYWSNNESLWTHCLACTSGNHIAHNNLGNTLAAQGRSGEAVEHFQKALEINPEHAEAHNNWGKVLLEQGRFAEASEHFQAALELNPDSVEAHNNLGLLLAKQGRNAEAQKHYTRAIELEPDCAEAHNNLGMLLATQGRTAGAIEHYRQAIEFKPDYAKAHYNLANLLAAQGQPDGASEHFQKAVAGKPDYAQAHNDWGAMLLGRGRTADAMQHFQKAIQIKPDYAEAINNLGSTLGAQGRTVEAVELFQKAIQIKPDYGKAHYNLAHVFAAVGRLDEAAEHCQRAAALMPDSTQAHDQLGLLLQRQGKFKVAIAQFEKVLELDPRHVSARNNLAWLLATCPEAALRDGNRAVELARRAELLSGGGSPEILDTLAAAYAEAGRYAEAVKTAERALDLANVRSNKPLAESIQIQIKLYEANSPFRDTGSSAQPQHGNPP